MLPMENLGLVPRKDLCKSSLNTIREQAQIAQRDGQEMLVLVFGHGDFDTLGVAVGYYTVFMRNIITLLHSDLSVILFMTSCYSGGWLVWLDLTGVGSDCSAMGKELRLSASLAASIIFEPLIAIEEGFKTLTKYERKYAIFETVKKLYCGEIQQMHFSAQNDDWEGNYAPRLGLPLETYKARWESLRGSPEIEPTDKSSNSGNMQILQMLKVLAREYFSAKPGPDNAAPNIGLHNQLRSVLFERADYSNSQLDDILDAVMYRLGLLHEADYFREQMGLEFPSIFDVDTILWRHNDTSKDRSRK